MRCKEARQNLCAYLDDEILNGSENEISQHLSVCKDCQTIRQDLLFSSAYLHRLKAEPNKTFQPDMDRVFKSIESLRPRPILRLPIFILILVTLGTAFLIYFPQQPAQKLLQKPSSYILRNIEAFKKFLWSSKDNVALLPESKTISFNTSYPRLVRIGENSWVSVEGKSDFYRQEGDLTVNFTRGILYFALDNSFSAKCLINVPGFQITTFRTEFSVNARDSETTVELLTGRLMIKSGDKKNLKAAQLFPGEAAKAVVSAGSTNLNVYKLTTSQKSDLAQRINLVKKVGNWSKFHPRQTKYEAGDIRIEFWRGE